MAKSIQLFFTFTEARLQHNPKVFSTSFMSFQMVFGFTLTRVAAQVMGNPLRICDAGTESEIIRTSWKDLIT
jgi:hypothetical protein